jgi:hypothetical protein
MRSGKFCVFVDGLLAAQRDGKKKECEDAGCDHEDDLALADALVGVLGVSRIGSGFWIRGFFRSVIVVFVTVGGIERFLER